MIADIEQGKSGGKVYRVAREEISVDAVECVVNLHTYHLINESAHHYPRMNITHQKCDVSVCKEVFVVFYERTINRIRPGIHASRRQCPGPIQLYHLGSHLLDW